MKGDIFLGLFALLLLTNAGSAQDSLSYTKKLFAYLPKGFNHPDSLFSNKNINRFSFDSLITRKLSAIVSLPDSGTVLNYLPRIKSPEVSFSPKPLFQIGSGYISYNWNHRVGMDSSIVENNISQHLISGSFNATIAKTIPLRVTYFERRSNSLYFKDYRDFTVDIDVQRYRQLRTQKALSNFKKNYENIGDPFLPYAIQALDSKLDQYKDLLNDPKIIRELIHSKETLFKTDFADTSAAYRDSAVNQAAYFIKMYDTLQLKQVKNQQLRDSLQILFQTEESKIKKMDQLLSGKPLSEAEIEQLVFLYGKNDRNIRHLRESYDGIRKLSVGRTLPDFSSLTLQNVNVNGLNVEYTKRHFFSAIAAGIVDFRVRDFLYSKQKPVKQYVYSARIGYGSRESDNIILTYYRGRKQLFGGSLQKASADIQGISLAGQFFILRQLKLFGEIAQSGVPYTPGNELDPKPFIRFRDNSQRSFSIGFASRFHRSQTMIEGYYQHTGLNYQSFNSFQYNATTNSWAFRLEQPFWKRQLILQAAFRKNDFANPSVLQRYNANTVFKNITLAFRKNKWPVLSLGYLPASQYTAVGNLVYENHYQSFSGNISHQYKLGTAKAGTLVAFSHFFNDRSDSGLIYYNARNYYINQTFIFKLFNASVNVSGMNNSQNQLLVMEEGFSAILFRKINAGFAIKINNLNRAITKIGFNTNARIMIKRVGEVSLQMEQNYLPAVRDGLYKYEMYNMGLIRYFK